MPCTYRRHGWVPGPASAMKKHVQSCQDSADAVQQKCAVSVPQSMEDFAEATQLVPESWTRSRQTLCRRSWRGSWTVCSMCHKSTCNIASWSGSGVCRAPDLERYRFLIACSCSACVWNLVHLRELLVHDRPSRLCPERPDNNSTLLKTHAHAPRKPRLTPKHSARCASFRPSCPKHSLFPDRSKSKTKVHDFSEPVKVSKHGSGLCTHGS